MPARFMAGYRICFVNAQKAADRVLERRAVYEMKSVELEEYRLAYHEDEAPAAKLDIALAVAEHDAEEHPERWSSVSRSLRSRAALSLIRTSADMLICACRASSRRASFSSSGRRRPSHDVALGRLCDALTVLRPLLLAYAPA